MKGLLIVVGVGLALNACSYKQEAMIDPALKESEILATYAKSQGLDSLAASATRGQEKAKKLKKEGEYIQSFTEAEQTLLQAKLAWVQAEQDSTRKEQTIVAQQLQLEQQEKAAYQNILQERRSTKGAQ